MKALVLGCGPAGLMAAHGIRKACAELGESIELGIISRKRKSELFGAQYLHTPIPGATRSPSVSVHYRLTGSPADYRAKVYGPSYSGSVSPEDLDADHDGWDIRSTYDVLWETYQDVITDGELSHGILSDLIAHDKPDLIVNSIHKQALCVGVHTFGYTTIWAAGGAPARGIHIPYYCPDNTVLCDGTDDRAWYRMSRVFDHTTVEWPGNMKMPPPVPTAAQVIKPTFNNCNCWPYVLHVGRYGQWQKGVLSHTAYGDAHAATLRKVVSGATA